MAVVTGDGVYGSSSHHGVADKLFGFCSLFVLDLVVVVVDGVEDSVGHFRLPPLTDDQGEVFVQVLVTVGKLDA